MGLILSPFMTLFIFLFLTKLKHYPVGHLDELVVMKCLHFSRDAECEIFLYGLIVLFSPQIIWRLGTEVLQHHPKKELEHFNVLYERMKNTGVKNFAKV